MYAARKLRSPGMLLHPAALFVYVYLRLVDDGGAQHLSVFFQHIQIVTLQGRFGGLPHGIHAANPAGSLQAGGFGIVDFIIDGFDGGKIIACGFSDEKIRHAAPRCIIESSARAGRH